MDTYRNNNNTNTNNINNTNNLGNNGNQANAKGSGFSYYQNQNFNHRNKFNNQNGNNIRNNNNNMNRNNRNQNGNNNNNNNSNQNSVLMQTNRFDNANLLDFQTGNNFGNKNFNNGGAKHFNNFNNVQNFKNHNNSMNPNQNNNQNNSANNNQNFKKGKLNKKRSFSKKYPNNGNNNNNNNEFLGERLNKSLNKDPSPNNSYMEMGQKMQSSISLDNFSLVDMFNKTRRSPKMPNSFTTFLNNQPMYHFNQSSNTIIEHEMAEQQHESSQSGAPASSMVEDKFAYYANETSANLRQQTSADESSFYSTPLNHTLPPKYNVDPSMSPAKQHEQHDSRTGIELTEDDGVTPIKYDNEKTLLSTKNMLNHDHHKIVSSSSSSSTSPDAKDESQPLVTASEGESSFGLEPTIENTITNVAIETSFANEIEHASGHVLGVSIKKFLDLDLNGGIEEQEEPQTKDTSASGDVESQNTSLKQMDSSTADSTATEDSSSSSSSSVSSPITSCTIETSSSNVKTISSSSITSSSSSQVSSSIGEQQKSVEIEPKVTLDKLTETVQLTPASLENNSNLFNYEKQINSNHSSGSSIDPFTNLNLKSTCPVEINYSTQTNYPSSTNSDYSVSPSSSSCSQTKSNEELALGSQFDINNEVSTLVNKIVLDAVAQAVKNPTRNESYIEIDINDTLTDNTQKEKLIIEDPILEEGQQKVNIKASQEPDANIVHYTSEDQKVVAGAAAGDQSLNVNTSNLMNESTLTVNSLAKKSSTSIKKDPLVDCFSCTIV